MLSWNLFTSTSALNKEWASAGEKVRLKKCVLHKVKVEKVGKWVVVFLLKWCSIPISLNLRMNENTKSGFFYFCKKNCSESFVK